MSEIFFKPRAIVCDVTFGCRFTVESSQPEPDLSNSFLYLRLAINTVCGVVGLGY